jgi:hypothetical protein
VFHDRKWLAMRGGSSSARMRGFERLREDSRVDSVYGVDSNQIDNEVERANFTSSS